MPLWPRQSLLHLAFVVFSLTTLHHQSETALAGRLLAGAAAVDITPKLGVSLNGAISKPGPAVGIHDRLHARSIVIDDGSMRLAIVVCDACMIGRDVFDAAKQIVADETGISKNRILCAATHTHAAVRAIHIGTGPLDEEYHEILSQRIAEAVLQAIRNLAPARIGYAAFDNPRFVSCRRFLCEAGSVSNNPFGESGEQVKSVSGESSAVIGPAAEVDPQFSILSIQHADGNPLAILGNYSVHYCGGYRRGMISADYFGYYATSLEDQLDAGPGRPPFVGIMSNGTSGNVGSITKDSREYDAFEWMKVSARTLASETLIALQGVPHDSGISLAMQESEIELSIRRPDAARLAWAESILAHPDANYAHRLTKVYAQEAQHLSEFPANKKILLQAIRIGDLAIAAIPCEVFTETGLAIKQQSPHPTTFTMELANGYGGYLPPLEQHALGGYETWPARSSHLQVEAEPQIRRKVLELLNKVRNRTD